MECCHTHHFNTIILDNKHVRACIESDATSVLEYQRNWLAVNVAAIFELSVRSFSVSTFRSLAGTGDLSATWWILIWPATTRRSLRFSTMSHVPAIRMPLYSTRSWNAGQPYLTVSRNRNVAARLDATPTKKMSIRLMLQRGL